MSVISSSTRAAVRSGGHPSSRGTTPMFAGDGHVRKQPDVLQDVADTPPQTNRLPLARVAALDQDDARIGHQQSVDELEERGLAGAAAADERDDLARFDGEVEVIEHAQASLAHERDVAELDGRHLACRRLVPGPSCRRAKHARSGGAFVACEASR